VTHERSDDEPAMPATQRPGHEPAERSDDDTASPRRSGRRPMPLWQELPILLVIAFCAAALIRTFVVQPFFIPSGSMEQTLLVGDRVAVNKFVYDFREPRRGEIVVFRGPPAWAPQFGPDPDAGFVSNLGRSLGDLIGISRPGDKDFIKRIIAVGGDRVKCCDEQGRITVNGVPLEEPYVPANSPLEIPSNGMECLSRRFDEVLVGEGELFVMGDHRLVSQDSRCNGTVPVENVVGHAFAVIWPSASWSRLPVPETFDQVPDAAVAQATAAPPAPEPTPGGVAGAVLAGVAARTVQCRSSRQRRLLS